MSLKLLVLMSVVHVPVVALTPVLLVVHLIVLPPYVTHSRAQMNPTLLSLTPRPRCPLVHLPTNVVPLHRHQAPPQLLFVGL